MGEEMVGRRIWSKHIVQYSQGTTKNEGNSYFFKNTKMDCECESWYGVYTGVQLVV